MAQKKKQKPFKKILAYYNMRNLRLLVIQWDTYTPSTQKMVKKSFGGKPKRQLLKLKRKWNQ